MPVDAVAPKAAISERIFWLSSAVVYSGCDTEMSFDFLLLGWYTPPMVSGSSTGFTVVYLGPLEPLSPNSISVVSGNIDEP